MFSGSRDLTSQSNSDTWACWTPPGHPRSLQSAHHCHSLQPALAGGPFQQNYSYGYTVEANNSCYGAGVYGPLTLPDGTCYQANDEGGNDDLRVPYMGYAAESISYRAAGVDATTPFRPTLKSASATASRPASPILVPRPR